MSAWPPPPHDPRDREEAYALGEWQVRVATGRMFEYFVPRGLWHVQLWHPETRISILTPSRLTMGAWEAFPLQTWKARRETWSSLALALAAEHDVKLPSAAEVAWVESTFVHGLVTARAHA
ncbi:MAG: hypothetical protein KIT84_31230 [Labilithrix sp.]|nr:hypothetical protein [Labilithrix sp.]MCW5815542.1 hypothetical protein [Labilithrix sp.]